MENDVIEENVEVMQVVTEEYEEIFEEEVNYVL